MKIQVSLKTKLHQVQSALRDLLMAHAGRVGGLQKVVERLPEDQRPKVIVGIFVLSSQKSRRLKPKSFYLPLAVRLEVATGSCHITWPDPNLKKWVPFREGLFRIAGLPGYAFDRKNASRLFQSFVHDTIGSVKNERPLVMLDATHTRGLWPWLRDGAIGRATLAMEGQDHLTADWKGVRILRIDDEYVLRLIFDKSRPARDGEGNEVSCRTPTSLPVFAPLQNGAGAPAFYSVAVHGGYGKPKRGVSCYRSVPLPYRPQGSKEPHTVREYPPDAGNASIPIPLEVVVGHWAAGDDPASVAHLAHDLRSCMAHYIGDVKQPPPLFLKRVIANYAIGIELAGEKDEEGEGA